MLRPISQTVTQSTFAAPCTPKYVYIPLLLDLFIDLQNHRTNPAGVNSGFQPVASGATSFPEWSFTVQNASAPLWFYCEQTG